MDVYVVIGSFDNEDSYILSICEYKEDAELERTKEENTNSYARVYIEEREVI